MSNKTKHRTKFRISSKGGEYTVRFFEYEQKVTICRLSIKCNHESNPTLEFEGKSMCIEGDTFDPIIGRELALQRALGYAQKFYTNIAKASMSFLGNKESGIGKVIERYSTLEKEGRILSLTKRI